MLLVAGTILSVGLASARQLPRQGLPDTGRVVVTGHFEDRHGHQICQLLDVFPAPVRDFVSLRGELWTHQIRVFKKDSQMVLNELRVDQDGQFTIDLPRPGVYRFELNPTESFRFVDPLVTVSAATTHIALAFEAKPYCLYGTILDATDGTVFYGNFRAGVSPELAVDVLQWFPANCLYGGRNRLQAAV